MHLPTSIFSLPLLIPTIHAHYIFSQLLVNDAAVGQDYTYIRKNTNSYQPSYASDVITSPNLICNAGGNTASSQTYSVTAGDKVGFKLSFGETIEHPGPGFVYMSRAPDGGIDGYQGDGEWFKVWESGLTQGEANVDENWGTWQKDRLEFVVPGDVPDGEYLVRVCCWCCCCCLLLSGVC
jgi:hypothetical protein